MTIHEVTTATQVREFLHLPVKLYRNYPNWIRPLDKDIEGVFDPSKNKSFRTGKCIRWILVDEKQVTIGRIAAFINDKTVTKGNDQPTGGLGFFECIENEAAAFKLFDTAVDWLKENKMEAVDGPINFGSRDRWWGLLIDGFDRDPNYQCNYNPPYYQKFFEAYGFQVYFYQFTFYRKVMDPLAPRLAEKAELIKLDSNYEFRHIRKNEISKLAEYIYKVYNSAWGNRSENPEITLALAQLIVKQMKPILDTRLVYFGFYKGEPISFFISLPEINQIMKYVNGKLDLIGKIKFLWHTLLKTNKKAFGVLFGIVPEHQGKGVDGAMILESRRILQDVYNRYTEYEMNWIGDFNPKMIVVVEQVGATVSKKHATFRKLFDPTKPFKRAPILK